MMKFIRVRWLVANKFAKGDGLWEANMNFSVNIPGGANFYDVNVFKPFVLKPIQRSQIVIVNASAVADKEFAVLSIQWESIVENSFQKRGVFLTGLNTDYICLNSFIKACREPGFEMA
jgi:hypothetical protein